MNDEVERDEFSVYAFNSDGYYKRELAFVSAETAIVFARDRAASGAPPARIIVTDGGDHTVFDWRRGSGVVFPPRSTEG